MTTDIDSGVVTTWRVDWPLDLTWLWYSVLAACTVLRDDNSDGRWDGLQINCFGRLVKGVMLLPGAPPTVTYQPLMPDVLSCGGEGEVAAAEGPTP